MKAWHVGFLYFVVSNAAVRFVTPLEEELAPSIFGEFPGGTLTPVEVSIRVEVTG